MTEDKLPKYYILKMDVLKAIESGKYPEGANIETERTLMERYGFSRITVRKAIDELVNEGYLYRIQGKGTFVKDDRGAQNLYQLDSCTEDVRRLGRAPSKRTIFFETIAADEKRAEHLGIAIGAMVYRMGRVTYADSEPLNYTISYMPVELFPGLERYDLEKRSLYETLKKDYGLAIKKARRTVEAVLPDNRIAGYLGISANLPVILFQSITYGVINGRELPFETFRCYYRTDHYRFYIDQVNQ